MGARRLTGAKGEGGRGYGSQSGTRQSLVRHLPVRPENGTGKVEGAEDQYPRIGGDPRGRPPPILLRVCRETQVCPDLLPGIWREAAVARGRPSPGPNP